MTEKQKRRQERLASMREMHLSGSSREEIAKAAGYTLMTVNKYLSDMGLLHKKPDDKTDEILRLRDEGKKLAEISRGVGLSEGRVSRILSMNGRGKAGSGKKEPDGLIDEDTVFAVYKPKICFFYDRRSGKRYIDVTELVSRG